MPSCSPRSRWSADFLRRSSSPPDRTMRSHCSATWHCSNLGALWITSVQRLASPAVWRYLGTALLFSRLGDDATTPRTNSLRPSFSRPSFSCCLQRLLFVLREPSEWHRNLILLLILLNAAAYLAGVVPDADRPSPLGAGTTAGCMCTFVSGAQPRSRNGGS